MTSAPLTAESYYLKWDSHSMHLNLSVATLYKHDRFADVMLLSSHPDCLGGPGVPAHKIILSTSSKFFASIFELTPHIPSQNGVMYLVLPPELSRRAIQVLVQYMYSGESTVSNDILNEVLNGGEMLKIRGLYRGNSSSLNKTSNFTSPIINANISNTNYSAQNFASPSLNVKNTKQSSSTVIQVTNSIQSTAPDRPFNLSVKKDIAIDPDSRQDILSSPTCDNIQCTISSKYSEPLSLLSVATDCTPQSIAERRKSSIGSNYSNCLLQIKEEPNDSSSEKSQPVTTKIDKDSIEISQEYKLNDVEYQNTETCIKEETSKTEIIENCDIQLQNRILSECEEKSTSTNVKETIDTEKQDCYNYIPKKKRKMEAESNTTSIKLKELKKHIPNNSSSRDCSSNNQTNLEVSGLKCEICLIAFNLPAEWVRHMTHYHTENELAVSNEKLKDEKKVVKNTSRDAYLENIRKSCNFCKQSFYSYKEMIAHIKKEHSNQRYS